MVAFRSTDASGRTTGLLFRCVLYSLLALGLIIVDKRYDHLGKIRRLLSVVAYPVQVAVASPFEGWNWFRDSVTTRDVLRADKTKLEAELRVAQFRLQGYEALEAETQRLRALRDNTADVTERFVVGDVMSVDLDAFRERVLVNKGAGDGIFVGQAVLDSGGVFGQVARVGQLTSEVILISDAAHAIPVQINRNGLRTIAVGTGETNRLKLPYLPTSADVLAGDLLVTSAWAASFRPAIRSAPLPRSSATPPSRWRMSTSNPPPRSTARKSCCLCGSNPRPRSCCRRPNPRRYRRNDARNPNPPVAGGAVGLGRPAAGGPAAARGGGHFSAGLSDAGGFLLVHRIAAGP